MDGVTENAGAKQNATERRMGIRVADIWVGLLTGFLRVGYRDSDFLV